MFLTLTSLESVAWEIALVMPKINIEEAFKFEFELGLKICLEFKWG